MPRGQYRALHPDDISMCFAGKFWQSIDTSDTTGCWPWLGPRNNRGRGVCLLPNWGKAVASRVAYVLSSGHALLPNSELREVTHRCDNPACCNPSHLVLDSHSGNMQGAVVRNRKNMPKGSRHANSKLTEETVKEVLELLKTDIQQKAVAEKFGVSAGLIGHIKHGRAWKHVR